MFRKSFVVLRLG